ncbi:MAG: guanylate kinase [Lachnospiraceae bacterium]|nr:guanylate kinase [Lachnospiraceae bacterium]
MGMIFYIMGKSASGKDSLFRILKEDPELGLKTVVMYTTRPMREGEADGREYFFTDEAVKEAFLAEGKMIECRTYQTIHGPWSYFTARDGQIDLNQGNYLMMGTLESYAKMQEFYGPEQMIPLYIQVEDGERLSRALAREKQQKAPHYAEMCRRFLADEEDFSEEKLLKVGIAPSMRIENIHLEETAQRCKAMIRQRKG